MDEGTKQVPVVAKRKPPAAGKGRPKGSKNKTTTALKEAILKAAEEVGEDGNGQDGTVGYLKHLAMKEPSSFASLLGKVLPLTVAGDPDNPLQVVTHDADAFASRMARLATSSVPDEGTEPTKH